MSAKNRGDGRMNHSGMKLKAIFRAMLPLSLLVSIARAEPAMEDLELSAEARTEYVIVKPDDPSPVDDYSVNILADGLKQKTGVAFPVLASHDLKDQKKICVGISTASLKDLGKDPLATLKDQETVVKNIGENIYIYGKGVHGNMYAVVDFLDNSLDRKWCVDYEKASFARTDSLVLKPFDRKSGFSFAYRFLGFPSERNYQYGYNVSLPKQLCRDFGLPEGTMPALDNPVWVHTSFLYMPPEPGRGFEWLKDKGYFKTNPDFYSMNQSGQRVPDQLCYGNKGLRAELTKNIVEHIHIVRKNKTDKLPILIALDQEDPATGKMCHCPECIALEAKYKSNAGAFFDYVIELCAKLKTEQPDVLLKTIAYRRSQTQIPPTMPEGLKFPDNVVVVFCGVDDVINKTWNDPENSETYKELQGWMNLTPHVWVWSYYLYSAALLMPFSNYERMALEMRMIKKSGAEGMLFEMYPEGGFTDLLQYIYLKLAQDVNSDVNALVKKFCETQYGPAAQLAQKYIEEMEAASKTGNKNMWIIHSSVDFDASFSYLTGENLCRWQKYFEEMNRIAGDDMRLRDNINRLRRSLDLATMGRWNSLAKTYPDYFNDYTVVKNRIGTVCAIRAGTLNDWELKIKAGDVHKPLPPLFDGFPKESISELVPLNTANSAKAKFVLDPDAAFGYAATVDIPDMPFNFGFHQNDTKKPGAALKLIQKDIKPGEWKLYNLGEIKLTPNCMIWFSNKSWMTNLELGGIFKPDSENLFDAYVSLKFKGSRYGGEGEDMVLCDRIILVNKSSKK